MGSEKIAIVVPTCRPHLLRRVESMALAQSHREYCLIPVSGDGPPGVLRNRGMALAKSRNIRFVSFWDDDDFYGPGMLKEQLANWEPGRIVGKTFGFVAFNEGVVYFPLPKNTPTQHLLIGGSIFGDVGEMPDWTDMPVGEDGKFAADCRAKGLETYTLSGKHFVYSRLGAPRDHTFKASDGLVWYSAGDKGVPTLLTPNEAMTAETPSGFGVLHKEWLHATERGRPRVPGQAQA